MSDSEFDDVWGKMLRRAVDDGVGSTGRAVSGARLRQILVKVASDNQLTYPPERFSTSKFGDFLNYFVERGVVIFKERRGQDLLIAPADRPDLLVEASAASGVHVGGLRRDLFEAFTKVTNRTAWYHRDRDCVLWEDGPAQEVEVLVRIPPVTIEQALRDRADFAAGLGSVDQESELKKSLDGRDSRVLVSFSNAIRTLGLQPEWHRYRLKVITDRIAGWAKRENVPWNSSWMTPSSDGSMDEPVARGRRDAREWRRSLEYLIGGLDQADLSRIAVPLDIVVRILQQNK
ncbi:MAG: hypothetical protein HQL56_12525 [Magnetococcales bacterium]|nr:hypothetical protein [Magnetococcales bacterium]